ncbi:MAG: hypothetical protein P8184_17430 [Calditrichia bacterium]
MIVLLKQFELRNRDIFRLPSFTLISFITILGFILTFLYCERDFSVLTHKTKPVPQLKPEIILSLSEASGLTEVFLNLEIKDIKLPKICNILRDDSLIFHDFLFDDNITMIDSELNPAMSYKYRAFLLEDNLIIDSSNSLEVSTMDTTSHDFSWEIYHLGNYNSYLLDVAIINDDDIWAVGEIWITDSTGNYEKYNAVHWDGFEWNLIQIYYTNSSGGQSPILPIRGIHVIDDNDIWIASGSIFHWNGNIAAISYLRDINTQEIANKLLYISENNIYGVGTEGLIVHFDGSTWQRMESGTDLDLLDIWGVSNSEIYCVGVDRAMVRGVALMYDGSTWHKMIDGCAEGNGFDSSQLFKTQLYGTTEALWVDEHETLYTVGNLMYQYKRGKWDFVRSLPQNNLNGNPGNYDRGYLQAIRGNASNDIFIFGQCETVIHFNGMSWKKIGPSFLPWSYRFWYNSDIKGGLAMAVGKDENSARIIKIWR